VRVMFRSRDNKVEIRFNQTFSGHVGYVITGPHVIDTSSFLGFFQRGNLADRRCFQTQRAYRKSRILFANRFDSGTS